MQQIERIWFEIQVQFYFDFEIVLQFDLSATPTKVDQNIEAVSCLQLSKYFYKIFNNVFQFWTVKCDYCQKSKPVDAWLSISPTNHIAVAPHTINKNQIEFEWNWYNFICNLE